MPVVAFSSNKPLKPTLPSGTWDSHMHVVEPERFPLSANAIYKPPTHTLWEAMTFESSLDIANIVLVQPSIYGNDNSCLLAALEELGPQRARGVVQFDQSNIDPQTLRRWHELGVRGVRINLKSVGSEPSVEELTQTLQRYAEIIRPLGWTLTLYIDLKRIPLLQDIVSALGVKFCIDHYGSPQLPKEFQGSSFDPYQLQGFSSLVSLLRSGKTWVKLSAPYRLSADPEMRDLEVMTRELLRVAPSRLVYATDWPHTRFKGVDARPFRDACLQWSGMQDVADKIFRYNAEELWDVRAGAG
ncbi:MAG: hypothetical protein Q9160_004833 [Pyrenula sp. 1 TL-2023]